MKQETLSLLFPQWQGSSIADPRGLLDGAKKLRALFSERDFTELEVDPKRTSAEIAGIFSHAVLKQQLAACHLIEEVRPERLLTLGGDCSVDLAPVSYLNERYDDLAVLWLDAHADLNTPGTSPSGALHGMVLRLLLGEGEPELLTRVQKPLEPRQVFLAGVRSFDLSERAYADAATIRRFGVSELERWPDHVTEALKSRGFGRLHLHLDLDVLDPDTFAATGYPTPGGLSLSGATKLLSALETSFEVVGITVTEYLPQAGGETRERAVLQALIGSLPKL